MVAVIKPNVKSLWRHPLLLCLLVLLWPQTAALSVSPSSGDNNICAAVLVPGFLTGADEFQTLCQALTDRGLPTVAVPMPNWHWLPSLGGRSARPILERIDFTVQHLLANDGDISKIPDFEYSVADLWTDFRSNPGGVLEVGGSSRVQDYPVYEPRGRFPLPPKEQLKGKKVVLIGHSAGGWISRVYLSSRSYGGKAYRGADYLHSLVTLGTPHANAPGPAFDGLAWVNEEPVNVRALSVAGRGFRGGEWGSLTQGSYSFCCPNGSDGTCYDGDGVTPVFSSLAMEGSEPMVLEGVGHFPWSDVFGGKLVAPELYKAHKEQTRPWYGSDGVIDQWVEWVLKPHR
jgi:triacylglycerol esterase/lipase EstA (alpha/beta hydrolase family)